MTGTLPLSSLIATLDRAELTELVLARRIPAPASVQDPLDLAGELLKPESIGQALTLLRREDLLILARGNGLGDADESRSRLRALGLLGNNGAELPEVTRALDALLAEHGLTVSDLSGSETPDQAAFDEEPDTASWFAAALTATGQSAWVLRDLERAPAKLNRNGGMAAVWLRAAEERLAIPHLDELVELLRFAQLAVPSDSWCVSRAAEWLAMEQDGRWVVLAAAAVGLMPAQLRTALSGPRAGAPLGPVIAGFTTDYPLATAATQAQIDRAARLWERLGITVDGCLSPAGAAAVAASEGDRTPADSARVPLGLPDTVSGIYIQPDLSVVVPGPLSAKDEADLAAIALPEQIGVASTLRISEATLSEAFHRGLTGEEIRGVLERLALTGIPQPVEYLITTLSERAGSIVVSPHFGDDGRARIEFARPELRATMLVDRRLAHLQLQEHGEEGTVRATRPLLSRLRADHVLAALLDARYPARGGGGLVTPTESRTEIPASHSDAADQTHTPADRGSKDALINRVLTAIHDSPTDMSRQLTLAIRAKSPLAVTVEVRGEERTFQVVPVSLAAGRLRALDEAAGVERTLPLEAITAISQLP